MKIVHLVTAAMLASSAAYAQMSPAETDGTHGLTSACSEELHKYCGRAKGMDGVACLNQQDPAGLSSRCKETLSAATAPGGVTKAGATLGHGN